MALVFSKKTYLYFDGTKKNANNRKWFEKNHSLYLEHVREPFAFLVDSIAKEYSSDLSKIPIKSAKITRPLRNGSRAEDMGLIKTSTHLTLCEKNISRFEWNPAIHIQFGEKEDDNLIGVGLYMTSSRQLSLMRQNLDEDFHAIHKILSNKKLKTSWGELQGEKYKKFPKGFSADRPSAKYLWHKQFYISQQWTRQQVCAANFTKQVITDIGHALPFLNWVRSSVGVLSQIPPRKSQNSERSESRF